MIAIVGCPSKRQFRQITRSDQPSTGLVCDIHNDLGTLSPDNFRKSHHGFPYHVRYPENGLLLADIYFPQCCPQFSVRSQAFRYVLSVVPKHGIVTAVIFLSACRGNQMLWLLPAVPVWNRVLPGDTDDRTLAVVCSRRFFSPIALDRQDLVHIVFHALLS